MTDLQRRCRRVVLLLGSLNDVLPGPSTWTGTLVRRSAKPGPAPSHRVPCVTCEGSGHVHDRFNRESQCVTCAGAGSIDVDGYTNQQVSTSTVLLTRSVTVRCDRCDGEGVWKFKRCELCDGIGRRSVTPRGVVDQRGGVVDQSDLELWGGKGSYHELERQLLALTEIDPGATRQVRRALVDQPAERLVVGAGESVVLAAAVAWLAYRMPHMIEVPAGVGAAEKRIREQGTGVRGRWANNGALKKRDQEIRRHARDGRSQQWIAREYGLTPARVCQLLKPQPLPAD